MQRQHVTDLFADKIPSSFVVLIGEFRAPSIECFWKCLINKYCEKRRTLIISSGLCDYSDLNMHQDSLIVIDTKNFDSPKNLLNHVSDFLGDQTAQPIGVFVESLSWFFIDIPEPFSFESWVNFIIASIFNISVKSTVSRLVCWFQPVKNSANVLIAYSSYIINVLESCATSRILCIPEIPTNSDTVTSGHILQPIDVWHRRSLQGECVESQVLFSFNKPPFTERGLIELNEKTYEFLDFTHRKNPSETLLEDNTLKHHATFALTLSESEKIARASVVLPYEINKLGKDPSPDECQIHYQPDCFDDLDDEDPDDDLDI